MIPFSKSSAFLVQTETPSRSRSGGSVWRGERRWAGTERKGAPVWNCSHGTLQCWDSYCPFFYTISDDLTLTPAETSELKCTGKPVIYHTTLYNSSGHLFQNKTPPGEHLSVLQCKQPLVKRQLQSTGSCQCHMNGEFQLWVQQLTYTVKRRLRLLRVHWIQVELKMLSGFFCCWSVLILKSFSNFHLVRFECFYLRV